MIFIRFQVIYSAFSCRAAGLLLAMLFCPVSIGADISLAASDWQLLSYRGIPSHQIAGTEKGLTVAVKRSASPLVTLFASPVVANELVISAVIDGELDLGELRQGTKGADDFRLRVGLIYAGKNALDPFQLSVAPAWLKRLASLLPEGTGISHVLFLNTYADRSLANLERTHPVSPLWLERFVLQVDATGRIEQRLSIADSAEIIGVWISTDGDDTGSCFDVRVERIGLN